MQRPAETSRCAVILSGDPHSLHGSHSTPVFVPCMAPLYGDLRSVQSVSAGHRVKAAPALPDGNWFVSQYRRGGSYFSLRLLCRVDLALSANSTSWRIASEREGLSGCCFAQVSIADRSAGESRIADTGSCPVAGRPRFFRTTDIDFLVIIVLRKSEPVRSVNFSPASTQATEVPHGPG